MKKKTPSQEQICIKYLGTAIMLGKSLPLFLLSVLLLSECKSPSPLPVEFDSMSEYKKARQALMRLDSNQYASASIELTQDERVLDQRLKELQNRMIRHYRSTHFFPPARNFYQSKEHIEETELFHIFRRMPKGGILHLHMSAMGDADWMIERAINTPEMHVYWSSPVGKSIKGQMHAYLPGSAPQGFHPVSQLAQEQPLFRDSLRTLLTFDAGIDQDSVDIWTAFENIFQRITGFVTYRPIWTDYLVNGLEILVNDNIQHVELRLPFWNDLYSLDQPPNRAAMASFVQTFSEAQERIRAKDNEFTMNIIHANLRFFDAQTIWNDIHFTHANRVKYPEWIRGYDLVAEEDAGYPTIFHTPSFIRLDSLERATGINLPLYLHDGESDWASVDNLYDAVLLGTERIGHGFNLFRFPTLVDMVRDRNITMEINPLSNQILGYVRDLRIHPASTYFRRGINLTISSDDPLIFDYHGLSYDFWTIFLAWDLDLADLKHLCENSLKYSAMTPIEKTLALKVWHERWNSWVKTEISN